MKIFTTYFLLFLPFITFGQLFPKVDDFKGNIEKVVEKKYGKEVSNIKLIKGIYHPKAFSGWKYTYLFDKNSNLTKKTTTFQGKVIADYLYQRDTIENRFIEREITTNNNNDIGGYYIEYEYFKNTAGQIEKINYWTFNARECIRELYQIEQNTEYKSDKLISFTRQNIEINGDTATGEKCNLYYDSSGKLIRIERKDIESGFKTSFQYYYNEKGFVSRYSVDFLVELQEYGKKDQIQDIYYKYDRHGNWKQMYWKSGKQKRVQAKRIIKYR
jgi:hypothetical protein